MEQQIQNDTFLPLNDRPHHYRNRSAPAASDICFRPHNTNHQRPNCNECLLDYTCLDTYRKLRIQCNPEI